jgi:hypothetical protein
MPSRRAGAKTTRKRTGVRKKAAVQRDSLAGARVQQINSSVFLEALEARPALKRFVIWPEKKKVERWEGPEGVRAINIGSVITIIRQEKKKVELEIIPVGGGLKIRPELAVAELERVLTQRKA